MKWAAIGENELARRTDIPQPTIHRIVSDRSKDPRDGTLRPIAKFFCVTVEELRTMSPEMAESAGRAKHSQLAGVSEPIVAYDVRAIDGADGIDETREALVDEVDVRVSGGSGAIVPEFVETKFQMPFQLYWFQRFKAKPKDVKLMRVVGSSMETLLFDGDRVAVHIADKEVVSDHVYVIILDREAKVKRLFRTASGVRVVSDNQDKDRYPDEFVTFDPNSDVPDRLYIVGRVIDRSGSGGL